MVSYLEVCQKAARAGGAVLNERLGKVRVRLKSPADLVTDADLASQEIVTATLREAFADHQILGEEDLGGPAVDPINAEFCWVIDPLDGTTNFAHEVPHFCVSIALLHRGRLEAGCIFDPLRDELFSAARGEGAQLNGNPIQTSRVTTIEGALGAIGLPTVVDPQSPDLEAMLRAIPRFQALRRTGSMALNLAYVAMGRFDAVWCYSARIWDIAAGILLIQESGGTVTSPWASELELSSGQFLAAANQRLSKQIVELLAGI